MLLMIWSRFVLVPETCFFPLSSVDGESAVEISLKSLMAVHLMDGISSGKSESEGGGFDSWSCVCDCCFVVSVPEEHEEAVRSSVFLSVDGVFFGVFGAGVVTGTSVCVVVSEEGVLSSASSCGSSKTSSCACAMASMGVETSVCVCVYVCKDG